MAPLASNAGSMAAATPSKSGRQGTVRVC